MNPELFHLVVLPVMIFLARILDVSIGTMRILFVIRGVKSLAALLGFLEVFIWLLVINRIMGSDTGWIHFTAYAAGFAAGTVVGITLESRLAYGFQTVRVITGDDIGPLIQALKNHGFSATLLPASGLRGGAMTLLFSTVRREQVKTLSDLISQHLAKAFVSVENVSSVRQGISPLSPMRPMAAVLFGTERPGK